MRSPGNAIMTPTLGVQSQLLAQLALTVEHTDTDL